jgi:hypothetical protein
VRGGARTRGFPPGSAQALVALVLGLLAGVVGLRRDELLLAGVFFALAVIGAMGLARLYARR